MRKRMFAKEKYSIRFSIKIEVEFGDDQRWTRNSIPSIFYRRVQGIRIGSEITILMCIHSLCSRHLRNETIKYSNIELACASKLTN